MKPNKDSETTMVRINSDLLDDLREVALKRHGKVYGAVKDEVNKAVEFWLYLNKDMEV